MPCYAPLRAVLVSSPEGRRLSFSSSSVGKPLSLPCGRCIGCRLERARQWAVRLVHESKMHDENSFITLTYAPEHLPANGSLSVEDVQLFMKRFRSRIAPKKVRFFLCGEYGDKLGRPHYHAILFGHDFADKVKLDSGEFPLYDSAELSEMWGKGDVRIGAVSFDSACYVANYATKKVGGKAASAHYNGRKPEFLLMSRRPGIGASWFRRFASDVFPSDEVVSKGLSAKPPRYYSNIGLLRCLQSTADILAKREKEANELEEYVTGLGSKISVAPSANAHRLAVREKVARAKLALKSRRVE